MSNQQLSQIMLFAVVVLIVVAQHDAIS